MKLFDELAAWWPNIAGPDEYRDEAVFFGRLLRKSITPRPRTLLDLGSGSGNNAFHLKRDFDMTCVDLSPRMQAVSRKVNPECAHVQADIRTLRLGKTFDAVFVHGVVARAEWMRMLRRAGFTPSIVSDKTIRDVFLGRRRLDSARLTGVRNSRS